MLKRYNLLAARDARGFTRGVQLRVAIMTPVQDSAHSRSVLGLQRTQRPVRHRQIDTMSQTKFSSLSVSNSLTPLEDQYWPAQACSVAPRRRKIYIQQSF